ncbi:DNA-binding transcriptional regulator, GntR family [Pseudoxanthomonas sp. GM95]|uniref:GntR family transcriptional regulator n=1 Tax=Pseudoxanthomonas sp. GM95 TaxID=1881043 RepID=UPI0008C8F74C|nr:GntR family transcriptional regulator [Pseudoxanthomonas sp. GM95]SEM51539.1 DNA-binding transcriptional regulator, GntR family [Pseudoxanthomonas sp. GM95]
MWQKKQSKRGLLYQQIRNAVLFGRFAPGERIDPTTLADEFKVSGTPVRFAMYQLVGRGLLEDHGRNGFQVPLPSEIALYHLQDWMERLLLMACEIGPVAIEAATPAVEPEPGLDLTRRTWRLFDVIVHAAGQRLLTESARNTSDRLAPIRHAMRGMIADEHAELESLERLWQEQDIASLGQALQQYHLRRKQLVPRVVAQLSDRRHGRI